MCGIMFAVHVAQACRPFSIYMFCLAYCLSVLFSPSVSCARTAPISYLGAGHQLGVFPPGWLHLAAGCCAKDMDIPGYLPQRAMVSRDRAHDNDGVGMRWLIFVS